MARFILLICLLMVAVSNLGCEQAHPGNYAQPAVEAQVKKSLKLTEIQIAPSPEGGYTGTGKTADGETMNLKITQDVAQKRLSWKADGDRGTVEEGNFQFE